MEDLHIPATKYTPFINFQQSKHTLNVRGESYPENAAEFYEPVFNWLHTYLAQSKTEKFTVNIELVYFNSSSSKILLDIFELLEEAAKLGKPITVNWIYDIEDEDSMEFGLDFQEDFKSLDFNMVVRRA